MQTPNEKTLSSVNQFLLENNSEALNRLYVHLVTDAAQFLSYQTLITNRLASESISNHRVMFLKYLLNEITLNSKLPREHAFSFLKLPEYQNCSWNFSFRGMLVRNRVIKPELTDFPEQQRVLLKEMFSKAKTQEEQRKLCSFYYRQALALDKNNSNAWSSLGYAIAGKYTLPLLHDFPECQRGVLQALFLPAYRVRKQHTLSVYYHRQALRIDKNNTTSWLALSKDISVGELVPSLDDFSEDQRASLQAVFTHADTPEKQRKLGGYYYRHAFMIDKNNSSIWFHLGSAIGQGIVAPMVDDFPEDQRAALQAVFTHADTPEKQRKLCSYYYRQALRININNSYAWNSLGYEIGEGEIAPTVDDFPEEQRAALQAVFLHANTPEKQRKLKGYYYRQTLAIDKNNTAWFHLGNAIKQGEIAPSLDDFPEEQHAELQTVFSQADTPVKKRALHAYYYNNFRKVCFNSPLDLCLPDRINALNPKNLESRNSSKRNHEAFNRLPSSQSAELPQPAKKITATQPKMPPLPSAVKTSALPIATPQVASISPAIYSRKTERSTDTISAARGLLSLYASSSSKENPTPAKKIRGEFNPALLQMSDITNSPKKNSYVPALPIITQEKIPQEEVSEEETHVDAAEKNNRGEGSRRSRRYR